MFRGCKLLVNLDLSNFDTTNTVHMYEMFCDCESLFNLDISSFNCSTNKDLFPEKQFGIFPSSLMNMMWGNMGSMFMNCKNLTNLTISYIDYKNKMFMADLYSGVKNEHLKLKVKKPNFK